MPVLFCVSLSGFVKGQGGFPHSFHQQLHDWCQALGTQENEVPVVPAPWRPSSRKERTHMSTVCDVARKEKDEVPHEKAGGELDGVTRCGLSEEVALRWADVQAEGAVGGTESRCVGLG